MVLYNAIFFYCLIQCICVLGQYILIFILMLASIKRNVELREEQFQEVSLKLLRVIKTIYFLLAQYWTMYLIYSLLVSNY